MNVVKLLAIVIVTVAVTLLCIRSGQALIKAPITVPEHASYRTPKPLNANNAAADTETVNDPTVSATVSATPETVIEPTASAIVSALPETITEPTASATVSARPETVTDPTAFAGRTDAEGQTVQPVRAASRSLDGGGGPVRQPAHRMAQAEARGKSVARQGPPRAANRHQTDLAARDDIEEDDDEDDDDIHHPAHIIVDAGVYNVHRYAL